MAKKQITRLGKSIEEMDIERYGHIASWNLPAECDQIMTELEEFFANLPAHIAPDNETERLKMSYAFFDGHTEGLKQGLMHHHATLLRIVPKKESA
jgi:hypothetical protein